MVDDFNPEVDGAAIGKRKSEMMKSRITLSWWDRAGRLSSPINVAKFPFTIGRKADNDCLIVDHSVSGAHARLVQLGNRWWLEDLGSTNGTWNGNQKVSRIELQPGIKLKLGDILLKFDLAIELERTVVRPQSLPVSITTPLPMLPFSGVPGGAFRSDLGDEAKAEVSVELAKRVLLCGLGIHLLEAMVGGFGWVKIGVALISGVGTFLGMLFWCSLFYRLSMGHWDRTRILANATFIAGLSLAVSNSFNIPILVRILGGKSSEAFSLLSYLLPSILVFWQLVRLSVRPTHRKIAIAACVGMVALGTLMVLFTPHHKSTDSQSFARSIPADGRVPASSAVLDVRTAIYEVTR